MAFSASTKIRESGGSFNILRGTWTGTLGDASGSMTGSGYCMDAKFDSNTTTGPQNSIRPTISNSSGTWTVTIPYFETVTAGTYEIKFK